MIVTNADVELPMFAGYTPEGDPILNDVRLIDHDVILVKKKVSYSNPHQQNDEKNIQLDLVADTIEFTRGFVAVDAEWILAVRSCRCFWTCRVLRNRLDWTVSSLLDHQRPSCSTNISMG